MITIPITFIHSFIHLLLVPLFSPYHTHTPNPYPSFFHHTPLLAPRKRKKHKQLNFTVHRGSDPAYLAPFHAGLTDFSPYPRPKTICQSIPSGIFRSLECERRLDRMDRMEHGT